jgi:predicted Zn-ribbon and HTH transcriptional regulator
MGIEDVVRRHKRIMFDTAPIIYFIEEHKDLGKVAEKIFRLIRDDFSYYAFSSVITLIEVLAQPLRRRRKDIEMRGRLCRLCRFGAEPP